MQGEADVLGELLGRGASPAAAPPPLVPVASGAPAATRHPLRPWLTLAAAAAAAALCLFGAGPLYAWLSGGTAGASPAGVALGEFSAYLPLLIVAMLGAWLSASPGLRFGDRAGLWLGVGALTGGGVLAGAVLLAWLAGSLVAGVPATPVMSLLIAGLAVTLVQSMAEEVLLRGWLQPVLAEHWRGWVAVLVTALLFAALHLIAGGRTPLTLLNLIAGGVMFGLLALRSGGLAAPVAAHFAYNLVEQSLLGLSPNPGVGAFGALVDLDLGGSALWGGSGEGLNAALALSFALAAAIVLLALLRRR